MGAWCSFSNGWASAHAHGGRLFVNYDVVKRGQVMAGKAGTVDQPLQFELRRGPNPSIRYLIWNSEQAGKSPLTTAAPPGPIADQARGASAEGGRDQDLRLVQGPLTVEVVPVSNGKSPRRHRAARVER